MSHPPQFIHLRLHSAYSISDGLVHLGDAIDAAAQDGQGALALSDNNNLFAGLRFYKTSLARGVKPILGADVLITSADLSPNAPPTRLLLLVKDHTGYLNLCDLLSRAWLQPTVPGQAAIDKSWFEENRSDGLIALSGGQMGDVGAALAAGKQQLAITLAQDWTRLFPQRYYIELQRAGHLGSETYIEQAVAVASELNLPVVATHPIQFMQREDFTAHEARVCIAEGQTLADTRRPRLFTQEQFFQTQEAMLARFADIPSAISNTVEIARRCNLVLELDKPQLPQFPTPAGLTLDDYLAQQSLHGLENRLLQLFPDAQERAQKTDTYQQRLQFEIETIIGMGFPGYFLIVADFINWAKNNGVPVGPGRGSGAGSLVAYALGITDLDPLRYNLLFERFLNPERVSMPDFDIDFCQEGRDRVIQYVKEKYGHDAVSQIATFGTMAAKAAVRDIGRVLGLGYNFVDGIARLIPFRPGKHVTIADALKEEPLLAERYKNEDEVHQLIDLAQCVEGLARNVGMHAGGVLIAPGKLTDFCPLYAQDAQSGVISQFDKDDVEAIGLVKFDFLGLTTLTILESTARFIRQLDPNLSDWTLEKIPLDDQKTFLLLQKACTVAVFQLESRGMQGMLKDAKPDCFEDIIALVALYRPGPMDLIPSFCARKHGREAVTYPDPRVESVLKETYGIMVYQEQVMQIAQIIGHYTLGGADLLRRAMGKKKPEEMAKHRVIFREGAAQTGLSASKADEIFDLMEKFAGYGFNKSHAAAYALLAYQTAWLKTHHPAAFMAANMSAAMDDTDKLRILYEDARDLGLTILPPDINSSVYRFEPADTRTILYGLGAIKGSGQNAIEEILRARKQGATQAPSSGPFKDIFDFCQRVDRRIVNRRTLEALIRAGAFDRLDPHRAQWMAFVEPAIAAAEQAEATQNQAGLFDNDQALNVSTHYQHHQTGTSSKIPMWSNKQRLREEKLALGFFLSGHPFDDYREEIRSFVPQKLSELSEGKDKRVAGILVSTRTQMTQRGKMLIAIIDDGSAQVEVTLFHEQYEQYRALLIEDELILIQAQVRLDQFSGRLRLTAENILNMEQVRLKYAQALQITFENNAIDLNAFQARLKPYCLPPQTQSSLPITPALPALPPLSIRIRYRNTKAECVCSLGPKWRLHQPSDELLKELRETLGKEAVRFVYAGK